MQEYEKKTRKKSPNQKLLQTIEEDEKKIKYYLTAKDRQTEYFQDVISPSKGFSRHVLGPVIKLKKGQNVTMTTENQLDEPLTYHWHGLMLNDDADGGPMQVVESKEKTDVNFTVRNEAATYWYHPHTYQLSPEQVYQGLAGLIYVEDENSEKLKNHLPHEHGVDDLP